jgi:hypothetical protein
MSAGWSAAAAVSSGREAGEESSAGMGAGATGRAFVAGLGSADCCVTAGAGVGAAPGATALAMGGCSTEGFASGDFSTADFWPDSFWPDGVSIVGFAESVLPGADAAEGDPAASTFCAGAGVSAGFGAAAAGLTGCSLGRAVGPGLVGARQPAVADKPHASITIDADTQSKRIPAMPPRQPNPCSFWHRLRSTWGLRETLPT